MPSLELDGEILERIVEGCEDQECSNATLPDSACDSKEKERAGLQFTWVNPMASSTMIEAIPDSNCHEPGCSWSSVYTWTIHENDEDFILEDSYMKDIDLCMYQNEALQSVPKVFQRTSTRADLSLVKVQEVPSNSGCDKEARERKCAGKKPMVILRNILRMKKSKDANQDRDNGVFNSKNIWKKMKLFNDKKQSDLKTLAMV